jgi:hypothetical protein
MAIIAKKTGGGLDLGPLAPQGIHQAIAVDAIDLGIVDSTYEGKTTKKHMARVIWQLLDDDTGKRYLVAKKYNVTLNEKSSLRKDLQSWFATPVTRKMEDDGFDVEKLVGYPCQLLIEHAVKGDRTYANVERVMPRDKKKQKLEPLNYTRPTAASADEGADDDDPPFPQNAAAPATVGAPTTSPAVTSDDIPF